MSAEQPPTMTHAECLTRLQEFFDHDGETDEDGITWPTEASTGICAQLLDTLYVDSLPEILAADTDGGISMEWRLKDRSHQVDINDFGAVTTSMFRDGKLIARGTLRLI